MKHPEIYKKLEYLSKIESTDFPFISLYLDTDFQHLYDKDQNARIFIKNCIKENEKKFSNDKQKLECLQKDTKKIMDYLSNGLEKDIKGLVIFACEKLGIFEVIQSSESFKDECIVNHVPHLNQFAQKAEESQSTLIILVDRRFSKIMEIKAKDILFEETYEPESSEVIIHSEVHGYHKEGEAGTKRNYTVMGSAQKTGGWSQQRFQRGINLQIQQHYRATAEAAAKLFEKTDYDNVVIIAQEHEAKNFIKQLPKYISDKICSIIKMPMFESNSEIIKDVKKEIESAERRQELEIVKKAINQCFENRDHCSLGIESTADNAKDGRIDKLIISEDMVVPGYKLGGAYYVKDEREEDLFDLVSESVRLTIKNGGEVEFIKSESEADKELERFQRVCAILRY
jgi:peptide subunit release factor 1 (eRF1)